MKKDGTVRLFDYPHINEKWKCTTDDFRESACYFCQDYDKCKQKYEVDNDTRSN